MVEALPFGALELSLEGGDDRWPAEIEAQGTDHLRVRLTSTNGEMPRFSNGVSVQCKMEDASGCYSASARVLSQNGPTLWLNVEPQWRKGGRRAHQRADGGFAISFEADDITGIGLCLNISAGGLRMRVGEELPLDGPVRLFIRLPHQRHAVCIGARVLYQRQVGQVGMRIEAGLKFVEIPFVDASKIAQFCQA